MLIACPKRDFENNHLVWASLMSLVEGLLTERVRTTLHSMTQDYHDQECSDDARRGYGGGIVSIMDEQERSDHYLLSLRTTAFPFRSYSFSLPSF